MNAICEASCVDIDRFRAAIGRQLGLRFDDTKVSRLRDVLGRRLQKTRDGAEGYLSRLETAPDAGEINAIARELTVGETYFFRNSEQFRALADIVLPERMASSRAARTLRLLSAGCSSGDEAYSLAILAFETIIDRTWKVDIRAVDLNDLALERAAKARYSPWALRETPADIRTKWFHPDGRDVVLDDAVRTAVTFRAANLASDDPELWPTAAYDVVFCRNVLMYFEPDQMRAAIGRIAQALAPGGYLFLGHAETLRGISDRFHLCHSHNTFYYRLKDQSDALGENLEPLPSRSTASAVPSAASAASAAFVPALECAWYDAIHTASQRVAVLIPDAPNNSVQTSVLPFDTAPALDLLRQERFSDALRHLRNGTQNCRYAESNPEILLLEATLLAHSGQFEAARDVASRLHAVDELNVGAQYLLALCSEHFGHRDRAGELYRVAAYLDPAFAMPRFHLGLLARRTGDLALARRELKQAQLLLEREDASRLLLFGGGFSRLALIRICQAALDECGNRP